MRKALLVFSLATALALAAGKVQALGFGKTINPTGIGQRLDFSAAVRLAPDETLEPGCIRAEVLSGDRPVSPAEVHVALQGGAGNSERRIRVTTERAIEEPVVTVTVTLGCSSRIARSFVAFLDPPIETLARARSDEPRREGAPTASTGDPLLASAQAPVSADPPARASAATTKRSGLRRSTTRTAVAASTRRPTSTDASTAMRREARNLTSRRTAVAAAPLLDGSRLQLETAVSPHAASPRAAASAAAPAAPVALASATAPVVEGPSLEVLRTGLAVERERNQRLEAALAQLRSDGQVQRKRLLELRAQVHQAATTERELPPLIFVIAGLGALLVAGIALMWRRLPARRSGSRWFELSQQHSRTPSELGEGPNLAAEAAKRRQVIERWKNPPSEVDGETAPAALAAPVVQTSIGGLEVTTVIDNELLARMAAGEDAERSIGEAVLPQQPGSSVDALIDLDQQVDFLLILGHDDAAIDVLAREIDAPGSMSPLPYQRLLAIHRRRGDRAAFESVAAAFQQRFGTPAPTWETADRPARALQDDPATLEVLQQLWSTPTEAMRAIEAWLLHRQPADDTFELDAYRELLFLYGVARDLAASPVADGVDVLLPLDQPPLDLPLPDLGVASRGHAQSLPTEPAPLDFDLSLPTLVEAPSELREAV